MSERRYQMISECAGSYRFVEKDNGSAEIHITKIDQRFANLWLTKMSELQTDDAEIAEYETFDK